MGKEQVQKAEGLYSKFWVSPLHSDVALNQSLHLPGMVASPFI